MIFCSTTTLTLPLCYNQARGRGKVMPMKHYQREQTKYYMMLGSPVTTATSTLLHSTNKKENENHPATLSSACPAYPIPSQISPRQSRQTNTTLVTQNKRGTNNIVHCQSGNSKKVLLPHFFLERQITTHPPPPFNQSPSPKHLFPIRYLLPQHYH